jgi:predicted dehydrogenase/threonine dehydrogenase-like Zn-dependent dehydrogenase
MKQVFVRSGQVAVQEVLSPLLDARGILVETCAAAISVGTETSSLRRSRQNPLAQIKSVEFRRRVIQRLRDGTFWPAVRRKWAKGAPKSPPHVSWGSPTGYSCAGRVLAVGDQVHDVEPGGMVACAGSPHAEVVYVPQNLFVPVPDGVSDVEASFVALGSIALHAVRQSQLTCGETVVVMGLGVVGQLVEQLVRVSGARSIALDLVSRRVELARRMGAHMSLNPFTDDVVAGIYSFTEGLGADAVILCMGGDSAKPVQQALDLVRERGRLIVVGTPRMEIPRGPFYRKEVELRIARSYGPGRYDPQYEEEGQDYPVGYVRWTERRNMAEFLMLVAEKRVDVTSLVTHRFPFDRAPQAYEAALGDPETALGIVLTCEESSVLVKPLPASPAPERQLGVAVVGAGSFARAFHLPNVGRVGALKLRAVVTSHRRSAERAAADFGAQVATTDLDRVLQDPAVELVVIATPHHLHARQAIAALEAGKAVFCEKPMGMTRAEVDQVFDTVQHTNGFYAIGFNRRFAPTVVRAKELLAERRGPLVLNYRVMGTFIPSDHWVYDPVRGGGRIVGEACHFFDLLCYLVGSEPVQVTAVGGTLSHPGTTLDDNVVCTLAFKDGSVASLVYGDLGQRQFPKERLEVFAGEGVLVINDDFRELRVHGFSGQRGMRLPKPDKGHYSELEATAMALQQGQSSPVSVEDGRVAMQCAFEVLHRLQGLRGVDCE